METKKLGVDEKLNTQYCIQLWLRDEQMAVNIETIKERIQPSTFIKTEKIAIVCFGPSLNKTWEQLKEFKNIITCSGSHKVLIDNGLRPSDFDNWWHVEVDPREHKIKLIGEPRIGIKYLIASCVHPNVIKHLQGMDVKLWHVFANGENGKTFPEIFPRGEWAVTGGSSVGLRAMTIARFLGYTNQHVFGMDGSFPSEGSRHAAEHPNRPPINFITEYKGNTYFTTPSFLTCAQQTFHELDMMKDVDAKFYGEGLVQEMAKDYVRKPVEHNLIAFNVPEVISAEYTELNRKLHKENLAYGVGGGKHADTVIKLADSLKTKSILDYGCGKSYLSKAIPFPIWEYDPAVQGKETAPRPADLVVCTDVLEHIEPDKLSAVLEDLKRVTKKLGYFVIHTGSSTKSLSDGRNAHLIQKDKQWWRPKLEKYFTLIDKSIVEKSPLLYVIVAPKTK